MDISKWFPTLPTGIDGKSLHPDRITTLEKMLSDKYGKNASIKSVERLRSKKNIVVHLKIDVEKPVDIVAKMFVVDKFNIEQRILKASWDKGLAVPKIIKAEDGVILMDFISGNLLVDALNQSFDTNLTDMLAEWYYNYHITHGMVKGDPRLRNFILHNGRIFGVDFEESGSAYWMFDIGGTAASLLDTDPIFDARKRRLCWRFLEKYLDFKGQVRNDEIDQKFITTVADVLKQTSEWREDSEILNLSKNIRQNGIPTD